MIAPAIDLNTETSDPPPYLYQEYTPEESRLRFLRGILDWYTDHVDFTPGNLRFIASTVGPIAGLVAEEVALTHALSESDSTEQYIAV